MRTEGPKVVQSEREPLREVRLPRGRFVFSQYSSNEGPILDRAMFIGDNGTYIPLTGLTRSETPVLLGAGDKDDGRLRTTYDAKGGRHTTVEIFSIETLLELLILLHELAHERQGIDPDTARTSLACHGLADREPTHPPLEDLLSLLSPLAEEIPALRYEWILLERQLSQLKPEERILPQSAKDELEEANERGLDHYLELIGIESTLHEIDADIAKLATKSLRYTSTKKHLNSHGEPYDPTALKQVEDACQRILTQGGAHFLDDTSTVRVITGLSYQSSFDFSLRDQHQQRIGSVQLDVLPEDRNTVFDLSRERAPWLERYQLHKQLLGFSNDDKKDIRRRYSVYFGFVEQLVEKLWLPANKTLERDASYRLMRWLRQLRDRTDIDLISEPEVIEAIQTINLRGHEAQIRQLMDTYGYLPSFGRGGLKEHV